jgi:hypothetical protein
MRGFGRFAPVVGGTFCRYHATRSSAEVLTCVLIIIAEPTVRVANRLLRLRPAPVVTKAFSASGLLQSYESWPNTAPTESQAMVTITSLGCWPSACYMVMY